MKGEYQGHHCWNCWNVALWIANDEPTYRFALECKHKTTSHRAADRFLLGVNGLTPDGAQFTHRAVKAAIAGL